MKTLFTLSVLFFFSFDINAQSVPNGNFEEWEMVDGVEQPVGWNTRDCPGCQSVEKTTNAIEGEFSIKISSTYPSFEGTLPGWAAITLTTSQQFHFMNASLKIDSIEMGKVEMLLYESINGGLHEIGRWETTSKTNGIEHISIPFDQIQGDTIVIYLTAKNTQGPLFSEGYSEVIIDNIELSLVSRTSEINNRVFKVFPNPVGQALTIEIQQPFAGNTTITFFNQLGQQVRSAILQGGQSYYQVPLHDLVNGIYFYQVENRKGVLDSGKIIVKNH